MEFASQFRDQADQIEALFRATFTDSEGFDEGRLVGKLARDLLLKTKKEDLFVYSAREAGDITACIIFSRLTFDQDDRVVFILSPVAVETSLQRQGIGQQLLKHGLYNLRQESVDVAITYGDPNYYSKVGFTPITEQLAKAPHRLSYPHGWLAQSLTDSPLVPLKGASRCVEALNRPEYW